MSDFRTDMPVYGIMDPDYARVFTKVRCLAWSEGYAAMVHGSFTRDLDILLVPWAPKACEPEHLIKRICADTKLKKLQPDKPGSPKEHGRLAWTLVFPAFADPRFVDISAMPRVVKEKPHEPPAPESAHPAN